MNRPDDRRVVEGFRLPSNSKVSDNEKHWIEFLRLASCDSEPPITLERVQALRALLDTVDN